MKNKFNILTLIIVIISIMNINTISAQVTDKFTDARDGTSYKTVKIDEQVWMAENLAYRASDKCWAYGNDESNVGKYGYLYGVDISQKVCPTGWHLPTDAEWEQLENYLKANNFSYDGVKNNKGIAKALASKKAWSISEKEGAIGNPDFSDYRNKTNFSALPGGYRENHGGAFHNIDKVGYWWTATVGMMAAAYSRSLSSDDTKISRDENNELNAASVRCIKD